MRRGLASLAAGLLCGSTGCKLLFEADTTVGPDGSVERTTRYLAFRDSDRKALESEYRLPPGGVWRTESLQSGLRAADPPEQIDVYEVSRAFAAGEAIDPDHVRRGREARIDVSVEDYFFVRFLAFSEVFPATADPEDAVAAAEELYAQWSRRLGQGIAEELATLPLEQAEPAVHRVLDPVFDSFAERVRAGLWSSSDAFADQLGERLEEAVLVRDLLAELPPPSPERVAEWTGALERAVERAMSEEGIEGLPSLDAFKDRFFGVYGFEVFQTYGLAETVAMPGVVVETNGTLADDAVRWEFDPAAFRWRDYALTARSRLVFPGRIAGAAAAALLACLGLWIGRRRRV